MRAKLKIAVAPRPDRELPRPSRRPGQTRPNGLYLLELRSHLAHAQSPSHSRKLVITLDPRGGSDGLPQVVRINHA